MSGPPDPERIAIIGAGSVGCMLAAHLAAAGHGIVICGRSPLERVVMTIDGDTVEHKIDGKTLPPGENASASYRLTCPGYFKAMGIRMIRGRDFDATDSTEGGGSRG